MIPFLTQPSLAVGPLTIHAFGVIVAAAAWAGLELARRRFRRLGLDSQVGEGMAWYALGGGFVGAHLFSLLFYFPQKLAQNPLLLFKLWEDISSFGSMLGGLLGIALYLWFKAPHISRAERWAYLDVAAFAFPVSLAIGRIACSLAHDHPGTLTRFPLAVSLESEAARAYITGVYQGAGRLAEVPPVPLLAHLGFHDLGWYEFLYLGIAVVPLTFLVERRQRATAVASPGGTFLALFILLYMPVRFGLDFLRVGDVRYAGLTPAQWVAGLMLLALPAVWRRRPRALAEGPPRSSRGRGQVPVGGSAGKTPDGAGPQAEA